MFTLPSCIILPFIDVRFWAAVCKTVRPMLLAVVCLSVLSVTLVHCGQIIGWIKMKLGAEVGLSAGHIALDGDSAPSPQRGTAPQFAAHVYCGQTAGCSNMPLGTEVDLEPGDIVLDGGPRSP